MKFNRLTKKAVATTGAMAMAMTMMASEGAYAADKKKSKEKCYGVAAKGMNDCASSAHSCAGQAKVNNHPEEWLYVPKGVCERLAGGSAKPNKA